jgi:ABC-2 type transport system ATP-binding protein
MTTGSRFPAPPAAELRAVTKRYGEVVALDRVDLALEPGEVTALLGPNGAGKTTCVKLLLGLTRPDAGRAEVFGGDPDGTAQRVRVGAMMQISKVPETLKVREHLELFASYYPRPLPPAEAIAAAGLEGLEGRPFGKLSGGQKQRLMFALAMVGDPDLLFLDEPTVGLDVEARRGFWEQVRRRVEQEGRTVLLTSHYLEEADALADRVVVIHRGRVVADGSPAEIKSRAAARRIRCTTRLEPAAVERLPGVSRVRRDRGGLEIVVTSAEPVVRELLALDPGVTDLEVTGAGLEEAFLDLTRDQPGPENHDQHDHPAAAAEKGAA